MRRIVLLLVAVSSICLVGSFRAFPFVTASLLPDVAYPDYIAFQSKDGPVYAAQVVAGPFDLHRKYLSSGGPLVTWKCNVASLMASQKVYLPESKVYFAKTSGVNSINDQSSSISNTTSSRQTTSQQPQRIKGLIRLSGLPRQLYWLKGIALTVIDERGKQLPTAEFICRLNLDVNERLHNCYFARAEPCRLHRIISLTQGQTKFFFLDGYAVPMASDEPLFLNFQAANRTTYTHRRVQCQLYFLKDLDTTHPIKALQWDCTFLSMPRDTHTFHAPYVPFYASLLNDDFTTYPRTIHAVWCHVHPLCTEVSLIERTDKLRKKLFTVHITTRTKPGLEIMSIENIYSQQGITLAGTNSGKQYELEAVYCNPTGAAVDSMVCMGIFATDEKFKKPIWATFGNEYNNYWRQLLKGQ